MSPLPWEAIFRPIAVKRTNLTLQQQNHGCQQELDTLRKTFEVCAHELVLKVVHRCTGLRHLHHAHLLGSLNLLESRISCSRFLPCRFLVAARLPLVVSSDGAACRPKWLSITIACKLIGLQINIVAIIINLHASSTKTQNPNSAVRKHNQKNE